MNTRIGLVGVGRMGYTHARIISQLLPNAQLIAIADINREHVQYVAKLLGVPHWYEDYHDLLQQADVDAIVIATSSNTHAELVKEIAQVGLPIFCEKPLALTLEETDVALTAVEKAHVSLQIGFHYHYLSSYVRARTIIEAGEIGTPHLFKAIQRDEGIPSSHFCNPKVSGGILIDMGIHEFDLAQWLLQDDIVEVHTVASLPSNPDLLAVGDLDHALVNLHFRSGAIGSVEVTRNSFYPDESRHDVLGSGGTLLLGSPPQVNLFKATSKQMYGMVYPQYTNLINEGYRLELEAFIHTVQTGESPSADGISSRSALKVALAAYDSLQSGKPIQLGI